MKTGTNLVALAQEVERRIETKKDFVSPVDRLSMEYENVHSDVPVIDIPNQGQYPLTEQAHVQLAEYLKIPMDYYRRMLKDAPGLLTKNVNQWLPEKVVEVRGSGGANTRPDRRMIRTLDGKARAVLSDGYRPLENEDLLQAVLPVLEERNLMVISCQLTETRLYIKAIDRDISRVIPVGRNFGDGSHHIFRSDTVHPIVCIGNSETGHGSVFVEGGTFTDGCTNLAIFNAKMRRYHTGARAELSDEAYQLLSDETKRLTDAAIWNQARDLVVAAFDKARFDADVEKLLEATEQKIEDDPIKVVERVAKRYSFTEFTKTGVLKRLVEGGDLSRYGLHSAITRHSADEPDYDEATKLERLGGQIIELPKTDWKAIAEETVSLRRKQAA